MVREDDLHHVLCALFTQQPVALVVFCFSLILHALLKHHANNLFLYKFTYRGYSVPQKKGFWSSPAGNPGRTINKQNGKGYRNLGSMAST